MVQKTDSSDRVGDNAEWIKQVITDCEEWNYSKKLSSFEQRFISDFSIPFKKWGASTFCSTKQLSILRQIEATIYGD